MSISIPTHFMNCSPLLVLLSLLRLVHGRTVSAGHESKVIYHLDFRIPLLSLLHTKSSCLYLRIDCVNT